MSISRLRHFHTRSHLSPAHLQRKFKAVLGVSPKTYQDAARLKRLKSGLKSGQSVPRRPPAPRIASRYW
jgi:AraC family transcriptional regulator, regulatory protein of adaptative response / methylated-DNA-[protein]-cysteine methyltransferase